MRPEDKDALLAIRGDQPIKLKPEVEALLARFEAADGDDETLDFVMERLRAISAVSTHPESAEISLRLMEITENARIDADEGDSERGGL